MIELPLRASEAAALADLVIQEVEQRPLTDDARNRLGGRAAQLGLSSIQPLFGSLQRDPVHSSSCYLAVDAVSAPKHRHYLLRLALSTAPTTALFSDSILIGRMRPGGGREIVVNAIPFSAADWTQVRTFAEQVDRAFLPRPLGGQPGIAAGVRHPEVSLPAVFDAHRSISKSGVTSLPAVHLSAAREMSTAAQLAGRAGEDPLESGFTRVSIEHLYHAGLWAAIRAGWREGWSIEAGEIPLCSGALAQAREVIRAAAGYSRFGTSLSEPAEPVARATDAEIEQCFETRFSVERQKEILAEFSRPFAMAHAAYSLEPHEIRRLAVKFVRLLELNEQLFDSIQSAKSEQTSWKHFDFEMLLSPEPREALFCLHWMKCRGRPAQVSIPLAAPALVSELAQVARHFNSTLGVHCGPGSAESTLEEIARAAGGRLHLKISEGLELELFDVLSEQSSSSPWRQLYDRMVERCRRFAAEGAFKAPAADLGRADGDPVLISWLGNVAGSRDLDSPDGDQRFFKEKLAELPADLLREVRRRNVRYIQGLAACLRG